MTQKNELKNQLLTRKKVNLFQDKTTVKRENENRVDNDRKR